MSDYYIKAKGEERGPFARSQLRSMWNSGTITSDTLFRQSESQDWQPINKIFKTDDTIAEPGAPKSETATEAVTPSKKSQAGAVTFLIILILAIAAIFFGNVHIISGGGLDSPRIVRKESFGFSETFINIDTIT